MSGGVQKRWLSVKSRIIRSYFEKKPRSRKKSKKVKKRIKLLQYDKKIHLPGEDHTLCRCLFVSCGDTAEGSLEATEKSFDFVALPVHYLVEFLRDLAVGLGRDHVNRALFPNHIADPIGIVCLVGQHPLA